MISVAVGACFSVSVQTVLAAPTGAKVVSGTATVSQQGNLTTVTNSPGAVINWQAFSIGANEVTRFIQQSAASSVLNRVVGVDPSIILGVLQSNGRVLLINPNGIVFGAGAQIDVAGLVASSLNLSNADFAAGRLRFSDTPGAGSVNNQGAITTPTGGQVYLIAPNVQNSGIITSPQGEIILAAGRSVDLVDAGTPNLRIEITAPDTQAINIGQIIARSGKIGIYAALVKNSGEIRADGVVVGANGEILLRAKQNVTLENGSVITASGPTAGKITIRAESGTVAMAGRLEANAAQGTGGTINISAPQGITVDSGARISAVGIQGGSVTLTAGGPLANMVAARPSQTALTAATATLTSGKQTGVAGTQSSGALAVDTGNAVTLTTGTAGGEVSLTAAEGAIAVQGAIDVSGTGGRGGSINIIANSDITLDATSRILANGRAGGEVRVEVTKGTLLAGGLIEGRGSDGPGGKVYLLAPRVALIRRALIDVTGDLGGGMALIGGDFQGKNPFIQNASRTYFGPDAVIRADAITAGDGGKVIVWSDDGTQAYGTISARGGALSGNGGFVETSGKTWLDFRATVDTSAPHGAFGTLLLDPYNLTIEAANPDLNGDSTTGDDLASTTLFFGTFAGQNSVITNGAVNTQLGLGNVTLQASNDLTVNAPISTGTPGRTLTLQAGAAVNINADITTTTGNIYITANDETATGARGLGNGGITMAAGTTITAGSALVSLRVGAGAGGGQPSGDIVIANIVAQDVSVQQDGKSAGNASILRASPAALITARNLLLEVDHLGLPANGSIGTAAEPIRIAPYGGTTINFESHAHEFSPGIFIDAPVASTDLVIGGVPFFGGVVKGVQTVSGGPIEITVNGTLSQLAGAAVCGTGGGSGGPICAGGGVHNAGDNVTLRANDMDLQRPVNGWDVNLQPLAGGNITLGSSGAGGSLHLSQSEIFQVDSFTLNIGEQGVSGDVTFVSNLTTPTLFGIRTGGKIESGAFTLTVGATGDGNIDLYAQTGIQLNVNAATLSAWNAGATGSINLAETSAGGGTLTLDGGVHPGGDSLRNDAPLGDITLFTTTRSIAVVSSITGLHDVVLTAGGSGNVTIGAQPTPVIVSAGGDIYLNATGGLVAIQGGDTNSGSGPVRDASTNVHATGNVFVNAGGLTVAAGNAAASGSITSAIADAELSAGGTMTLTLGTQGLTVVGGQAMANAQSDAAATASASSRVTSGGVLGITVTGGNIVVAGGNATAMAIHYASEGGTAIGDNTATATANTTLSGGTDTNITLIGGNLVVAGGQATASAHKYAGSGGNTLNGANDATANANVMVKATSGNLTIDIGGGTMQVGGNFANAGAYHFADGGSSNLVTGNNTANAAANIGLSAGNQLTITGTTVSVLRVGVDSSPSFLGQRPQAHADANKRTFSGDSNNLDGTNQATANANLTFDAAGPGAGALGITVGELRVQGGEVFAQAYHAADGGNANTLGGDNTATANSEVSFNATHATGSLTISLGSGPMFVSGPRTSLTSDATRTFKHVNEGLNNDLTTGDNTATAIGEVKFTAGTNLTINAGSFTVGSGGGAAASADKTVTASGTTASGNQLDGTNTTTATAKISFNAGNNLTIDLGTSGGLLSVNGARADAYAYHSMNGDGAGVNISNNTLDALRGNNSATVNAGVDFIAGGALLVNTPNTLNASIDGGRALAQAYKLIQLTGLSGGAAGNTLSGDNTATATNGITLSGASVTVNVGSLNIYGGSANAHANVSVGPSGGAYNGFIGNNLSGNHTADATSNITLNATGGALTVNATGGLAIYGSRAEASAYKHVAGSGFTTTSSNTAAGNNTATANSNINLTGATITLDLGAGSLNLNGSTAYAYARHTVENGNNNILGGDHIATANSNISLTAVGALTVNAVGGVSIGGEDASAYATKRVGNSGGAGGNFNMLSGDNTATANSNISLSGTSLTLDLNHPVTASLYGNLYIAASDAEAYARHRVYNGNDNTLSGIHSATANTKISLTATTGALTVNAKGGVQIYGSSATASAYKKVITGNNNTLSGDNTAAADSSISLSGNGLALNLGAGGLTLQHDSANARAYHSANGNTNSLSGVHGATANSNISLNANGGALTVTAGSVSLGDGGEGGAFARAYMVVGGGDSNVIGGGAGTASSTAAADSNISLNGSSITLDLGTGSMTISGARADADAYHNVASGLTNSLTGDHVATANSNISLTTGGALTVNAAGGVTISGNSASASAYKHANGSGHAMAGNNTATANSNISLSGASVTLNLGAGLLNINGSSADASAYHTGNGTLNNIGGNHVATASSNITLNAAGGALTINAGGVTINNSSAEASAYKYVPGTTNTVSGDNTATANSNITLSGASITLNLGAGSLTINGDSASAEAYHYLPGGGNILSGNHIATANSNITLAATGALIINATGGVTINGSSAEASAYKYIPGITNTVAGNNTSTANSNITLSGTSVALNLGGGSLIINGSSASARAYYQINGANNILSGAHNATANSNITVNATGGNLTIDAGSIAINGDDASARAYMYVNAGGNTIGIAGPASNTATADATIGFTATGSQTLTVAGGITANASISASADAYHQINNGAGNNLNGNNTAIAKNGLLVSAGGTLTVAAGSLTVGGNDASASAYKYISGASSAPANTNQITGNNSATGTGLIKFSGANISVSLTGGLGIFGSYVSARAYNQISTFSNNNTLTGNNTAKAAANIVFVADNTLAIVAGSVTARASSASATAHNTVSGGVTGNTVSGANSATGDANIRLSATAGNLTMNVGAGNVLLQANSASAHAMNIVDAGNTVTATNTATGHGNVLVAAGADMTINVTSGNLTVQGDRAIAGTSGGGTNLADANANAGIFAIGVKTVNVSNTVFLTGGSATATGPGATAAGFAMLDPGSLDLTAAALTLTPNAGSGGAVVMSAFGPINLTIGGSSTPLSSYAAPGNILGTGTLTSGDPLIIDISGTVINITDRFGLPPAFLAAGPGINIWTGIAGDFLWASGGNWSLGHEPNSFETAQISDLTGTPTISILGGAHTPKAFQFFGDDIFSVSGGSLTFTNASSISNGVFSIGGGTVNANAALTANTLNITGGGLFGTGGVTVTNSFIHTGGVFNTSGNVSITQLAGNLALTQSMFTGSLALTASAGNISITNASVNATGTLDVTAADNLDVIATTGPAMLQSSGLQTIAANGITVQGGAAGSDNGAMITGNSGQNITVGAGGITLTGGTGGTNNGAFIQQFGAANNQTITVNGGGTVSLTGGGGTQNQAEITNMGKAQSLAFTAGGALNLQGGSGAGGQNRAGIQNGGAGATTQTVSFVGGGAINLTGGTVGLDNNAEIHANTGNQTIIGNPDITLIGGASGGAANSSNDANISLKLGAGVQTINAGNISLTGGAGGTENSAGIGAETSGQTQNITATGSVTLTGGAGTDAVAAIASDNSNVNITLNAGGPVTLTGGSGGFVNYGAFAAIGAIAGFNANVTINGQAGITLTKGTGLNANAMIGSDTGGGTVMLKAGLGGAGNLALNDGLVGTTGNVTLQATAPGGLISQLASGMLKANILSTTSDSGTALAGANQVTTFNATNTASGNVALNNSAAMLTVSGISESGGGTASVTNTGDIKIAGAVTSTGGGVTLNAGDTLFGPGTITGSTISLTSVNGMSSLVNSNGVNLSASNTGTTGDILLTSTAPLFTVGVGGATFSNAAAGGGYYITAQNNMALNAGTANDRQAFFGAGNMLTVNGYSNASGMGVLMVGNNVTFNGATNVSGALGVIGGNNIDVNTTVQGGSVNVVAGALNVNGGDFLSTAGNFVGTVTGDVNVAGGGRIYGNPDVNLTVGGTIFINGANSKIEAFSPTSIRVLFPLLASGGFQINGAAGTVWDVITNTGFFAGGLPAVLGGSLQITYGAAVGLPPSVVAAINTIVDATKDKDQKKDKDANKEKTDQDEKSVGGNLKMQCS